MQTPSQRGALASLLGQALRSQQTPPAAPATALVPYEEWFDAWQERRPAAAQPPIGVTVRALGQALAACARRSR